MSGDRRNRQRFGRRGEAEEMKVPIAQSPPDSTPIDQDGVRGWLDMPADGAERGLALTHGAGSDCGSPLLVAIAKAFRAAGFAVLRCDLPFRQERRSGPPSPSKSPADRAGLKRAVALLRGRVRGDVYLGGHSYGGRQASMLAAEEPALARGLLLLSYPLHPPAKPAQWRTEHFPELRTPALFVHGAADPFGSTAQMEKAIALIPAPTRLITIEGAGHDLRRGRFDASATLAALLRSLRE
jgi:uncharacterized protein